MTDDTLQIGAKAPPFALRNQDGREVALKGLLGKWIVLYFYPKDDTPGCTTEACEFTSQWKSFEALDAQVVGVSPDSPPEHQKFIAKYDLKVELLSDPDHAVLQRYGAWGEKTMYGKKSAGAIRSTVILDPQGKIAYRWSKVTAAGHAQAVAEKLGQLQET
ncbi:MAG: peroxiredoxin [Thermoguttaceae bacterium]|jgi:peroxiredoxin Q/BCP